MKKRRPSKSVQRSYPQKRIAQHLQRRRSQRARSADGFVSSSGSIPTGECPDLQEVHRALTVTICRKFFTFIITLNGMGILLAALNIWTYPRHYTGAFVLGNLLFAILMRNELFGRLLYLFVNSAFAKVCMSDLFLNDTRPHVLIFL